MVVLDSAAAGSEGAASAALQLAYVLGVAVGTGAGGAGLDLATRHGYSTAAAIAAVDVGALLMAVAAMLTVRGVPAYAPAGDAVAAGQPSATPP